MQPMVEPEVVPMLPCWYRASEILEAVAVLEWAV